MRRRIYHFSKRILILSIGVPVIAVGIALLVLPGPGLVVIAAGLAILSLEFEWARRWLKHTRNRIERVVDRSGGRASAIDDSDEAASRQNKEGK